MFPKAYNCAAIAKSWNFVLSREGEVSVDQPILGSKSQAKKPLKANNEEIIYHK